MFFFQSASIAQLKVIAHPTVFQGRSFIVFLNDQAEVSRAFVAFKGRLFNFYPYEDGLRAIVPTAPEEKTGEFPLAVEALYKDGKKETLETTILLETKVYPKTSFWLKPGKKKYLGSSILEREWASIEAKIVNESPQKLWDGFFAKPVPGITTMAFGTREFINKKISGRHRGWDFRAAVGTKIAAPNNGVVVFADDLKSFGGTVVIDHGQGVNTLYFHLSKIGVTAGQGIRKGDIIGLTGNTGISSGPHLHWGMSVHNVRVDPNQWVMTVMP